jgi:hypothetical protein
MDHNRKKDDQRRKEGWKGRRPDQKRSNRDENSDRSQCCGERACKNSQDKRTHTEWSGEGESEMEIVEETGDTESEEETDTEPEQAQVTEPVKVAATKRTKRKQRSGGAECEGPPVKK